MHGQKNRRKRFRQGSVVIAEVGLLWRLLGEPQATTEHGYRGLRISVQIEHGHHRELILEYPFPKKAGSKGAAKLPQRAKFSEKTIEADVRQAIAAGWDPASPGKSFILRLPRTSS
jgi:hypothetical protein